MSELSEAALAFARERAFEHTREDRIFTDPLAAGLGGAGVRPDEVAPAMRGYVALRTLAFDEGLLDAACPQVVLLGSGLDTRAFRLPWPAGTVVFEVDVDELVEYREARLEGAAPRCDRRVVRADLRGDWAPPLRRAGFDRRVPTAWLAEGVLMSLSREQNAALVIAAAHLSAPGSVLLAEHVLHDADAALRSTLADPMPWLADLGWAAARIDTTALAERVGRPLPPILDPREVGPERAHLVHATRRT